MSDSLDAELDRLFQLPPAEMVAERDALSARLKKAGDKSGAGLVKALRRPTPAAWAVNQLHYREPALLEQARAAADALRDVQAQDDVPVRALTDAAKAQRAALHAAVERALVLCSEAGLPDGVAQRKKQLATLQACIAGLGDEPPGRMTHDLEPSGFDAIGAVGSVAARAAEPPAPASAKPTLRVVETAKQPRGSAQEARDKERAQQRELALARARNEHTQRQARAQEVALRASQQRARHEQLSRELSALQSEAQAAEQRLLQLRAEARERAEAVRGARTALEEVTLEQKRADAALAAAAEQLTKLGG